jgi:uncharacterized protein (DUF488 family)
MTVWTAGHSNLALDHFLSMLSQAGIEALVDVRRYPLSRRNPQFNHDDLAASLAAKGIEYRHEPALGGRRKPLADSFNQALRNDGFRGFADYMATDEFLHALGTLVKGAEAARTTLMCAEAVPWRCHRSLIADALLARGVPVMHLVGGRERPHTLSPHARVHDARVAYPSLL